MLAYCIVNTLATSQKLLRNKIFSKKKKGVLNSLQCIFFFPVITLA